MKHKSSFFAGMLTMLLIFSLAGTAVAASSYVKKDLYYGNITVTLDGKKLDLQGDREPFIIDGVTFLPVRAISEALGLDVDWDGNTKRVIIKSGAAESGAAESGAAEKETAFSRLVSWISTQGVYVGDSTYMFTVTPSSDLRYALFYDLDSGTLTAAADTHGTSGRAFSQVSFGDGSEDATVLYKYYASANDSDETFSSRDTFLKSSMNENMNYTISNAGNMASETLALHKGLARSLCISALDFIDLVYENELKAKDTSADLGFSSHIKSITSSASSGQTNRAVQSTPITNSSATSNSNTYSPAANLSEAAYQSEYDSITSYYDSKISKLERDRDRAVKDIKGQYAARTGGFENSAGTAAANNEAAKYNEKIKELQNERARKIAQLNSKYGK